MSNAATTTTSESPAHAPCPRCRKPLVDPSGLGWCRSCGYCKSLDDTPDTTQAPVAEGPTNQFTATGAALGSTPAWFWIMVGGIVLVVAGTYFAGRHFTLTPFHRALFTTLQIGGGVFVLFLGQFIALLRIAPEDSTLSFKDAVVPFRLYGMILKRLPSMRLSVYTGAWGAAAIAAALIFIGGLGHWFKYMPTSKTAPGQTQQAR